MILLLAACLSDEDRAARQSWSSDNDWRDVAVGEGVSCGLKDSGDVRCWGIAHQSEFFQWNATEDQGTYLDVDTMDGVACALSSGGRATCLGYFDAYNDETRVAAVDVPVDVPAGGFQAISVSGDAACALGVDGATTCWGPGAHYVEPPVERLAALDLSSMSYGCGIDSDTRTAVCWANGDGAVERPVPDAKLSAVSVAWNGGCGLVAEGSLAWDPGDMVCWNRSDIDEQDAYVGGDGRELVGPFERVLATAETPCGIQTNGVLQCSTSFGWDSGLDMHPPDVPMSEASIHHTHGCAVTRKGFVRCWPEPVNWCADEGTCQFRPP